ncbi:NAD-dependent epimerase/dehydratase family protein [Maricaulis sp.]|uniref:NAD-dependent epimerase/dehydratase family protein n=1 Tax=Maricaulis sp. TaxID=1486257 RepID=UPI003A94CACD
MASASKIAVIGARSFMAQYFVRAMSVIAPEVEAVCLDRPEVDLSSRASLAATLGEIEAGYVVNFAAISSVTGSDVQDIYRTNAFGQLNLLETLGDIGFSGRLLFVSSGNVYGSKPFTCDESTALAPQNHYGCSKVLAEQFCNWFTEQLDVVIARPMNCIGVGQKPFFLVPKLVHAFSQRQDELAMGNLDVARDFVDIRDAAEMLALVLLKGERGQVYNVSNGTTHSIRALLEILAESTGHEMQVRIDPQFIRPNDLTYQCASNEKVKQLGYNQQYRIDQTLQWMLGDEI